MKNESMNVFGEALEICGINPMTGFFRDGCCNTGPEDLGIHTVCAVVDEEFLSFTKSKGNDLSTPTPHYQFPGLKPGDRWCLCLNRWLEARQAGVAPKVILEATHIKVLDYIDLESLIPYALPLTK